MYSRQHRTSKSNSDNSDAAASNQFAPRPFVVQPQVAEPTTQQNQTDDVQAVVGKTKEVSDGFPDPAVFTRHVTPPKTPRIQMKLTIGKAEDKYEQEADRVASQAVQQINTSASPQSIQGKSLQRQDVIEGGEASTNLESTTEQVQKKQEESPNQTGLPDDLKSGVENLSGYSLKDVQVHYNSPKPTQLKALAYTQGTEIHVAPGEEKHLPHEAWHVVQQMQGRVKPAVQMKGVQINADEGLEREADVMGREASVNASQSQGPHQEQESSTQGAGAVPLAGQLPSEKVAQFITGYGNRENHYKEVNIKDDTDTDVEKLKQQEKTLAVTDMDDMDMENDDVRSTTETGYKVLQLGSGEQQSDWQIADTVLHWSSARRLSTLDNFNLPVSCIESSEHIIQHIHNGGNIPDYDPANPGNKQVGLHFKSKANKKNKQAQNISQESLEDLDFKKWESFDFDAVGVAVGQGLLVVNPAKPGTTMHAVVVVGKNTATGQLIVLERNAGNTTGDNMYVDRSWLVNVYNSPAAFRDSVGNNLIIGKLAAI